MSPTPATAWPAATPVTPVDIATGEPGTPIRAGRGPQALAMTPDGRTLYVADVLGGTVSVISLKR